jgi:hypothetical protein
VRWYPCAADWSTWTVQIVSEGAISAGVRRVEAVTGSVAFHHLQTQLDERSAKIEELSRELLDLKKTLEKERTLTLQRDAEFSFRIILIFYNLFCASFNEFLAYQRWKACLTRFIFRVAYDFGNYLA